MRPKALVIKREKTTGRIMAAALMLVSIWVILAFALQAYGAGAPKASTKKSKSAAEKRAEEWVGLADDRLGGNVDHRRRHSLHHLDNRRMAGGLGRGPRESAARMRLRRERSASWFH